MALKDVAKKAIASKPFSNDSEVLRAVHDVAVDGGLTTDEYTLLEAKDDLVITGYHMRVKTAAVGVGASMDVGIHGGDEDVLVDGVATGSLTLDALIQPTIVEGTPNVVPLPLKLASGGKIKAKVLGAAFTAGVFEHVFEVKKF